MAFYQLRHTLILLALIVATSILFVPTQPTQAATTINVSTAAEFIQAINDANSEVGLYVGADTITLAANITLTAVDNTTDGRNGLPSITSAITIEGNGFTIQRDPAYNTCGPTPGNAAQDFRILHVSAGGNLSLYNVTIANGCANIALPSNGGGIYNVGGTITTIANSTFSGNQANGGGGIYNRGPITTIANSAFSGNQATSIGGGIYNGDTITTIVNSTFSGNQSNTAGGGIFNNPVGRITTIANSTFSGNQAGTFGGGVYNDIYGRIATIANTIIANNTGGNCRGPIWAGIKNLTDSGGCAIGWTNTLVPTDDLGPLADNGGPTQTIALIDLSGDGNPAIDTGDNPICANAPVNNIDQRGAARPVNTTCDIGAYEYGSNIGTLSLSVDVTSINENPAGTATFSVTVNNLDTVNNLGSDVLVYLTLSGTAQDGSDYTTTFSSPLTFPAPAPGITTQTVTVTALDDGLLEALETVTITISGFSGPVSLGTNLQTVSIISDDIPPAPPAPQIGIFDPAISKMGILHPGEVGVTGEQLEWIITVSNTGTAAGNNVAVTDTLVSALQIDYVDAPGATVNISGQTVTVTYATINPGETFQFSIWTTVLNGVTVENTACVADPTQPTGEECVTALPVSALPSTGEVPDN
jgi:uncharacterized repeat protein (TIGR01451 family)